MKTECNNLKVEFRVPISANEKFLRMLRYLIESVREYSGEISKSAKFVVSISRDEPYRDLILELPWLDDPLIELRWIDTELFDKHEYDGTGLDRYFVKSDADVVIMCDADILVVSSLDEIIIEAHKSQKQLGFIAHTSPFDNLRFSALSEEDWWQKIFNEAGLSQPELVHKYTGERLIGALGDARTRLAPYYFNFGFIVSPRWHIDKMSESYERDIRNVDNVLDTWFKSQIVNTISYRRHNLACGTLSINYNFPLHVNDEHIREINSDLDGKNSPQDIKVFHYLGEGVFSKEDFSTRKTLAKSLERKNLSPSALVFQEKLRVLYDILGSGDQEEIDSRNIKQKKTLGDFQVRILSQFKNTLKMIGLFDSARKIRQRYFEFKLYRRYPRVEEQLIARLIDVYYWSLENFESFGASYFNDSDQLRVYFGKYLTRLVDINRQGFSKGDKECSRLVEKVRSLFAIENPNSSSNASCNSNISHSLIIACGGRRTGTTLLNAILTSDPSTNTLRQEAQILTRLAKVLSWYKEQDEHCKLDEPNRKVLHLMMEEFVQLPSIESEQIHTIVLKNPEFSFVIDELYEVFPNAVFIATIRDPRDQILSELEVMKKDLAVVDDSELLSDSNIKYLARNYLRYQKRLEKFIERYPSVLNIIKYEDLVTKPNEQIVFFEKITGLTLGFCPASEWKRVDSKSNLHDGPSMSDNYGKPITDASVGKFRKILNDKAILNVELICEEIMIKYHYKKESE